MNNLLIERVCRQVLNEYMGISDEVTELADEAFGLLSYVYDNTPRWFTPSFIEEPLKVKHMIIDLQKNPNTANLRLSKVVSSFNVILYGYDQRKYSFEEYCDFLSDVSDKINEFKSEEDEGEYRLLKMSFVPSRREIKLFIPFPIDGNIEDDGIRMEITSTLRHEVEHAWQSYKRGGTKITPQYLKSTEVNDWVTDSGTNIPLLKDYLKHCYYTLEPDEIDAKIHEIWYELENGSGRLEDCEGYKFMLKVQKDYKWVCDLFDPKNEFDRKYYERERNLFAQLLRDVVGLNAPSQWFKHCEKGIKKFNDQIRRVAGRYAERSGKYGNGSFKQYANGEIPQGELFRLKRENPSLWGRIVNRFKNMG